MGLLNKIKMRTYCKEARESFTNTSTSFYELNPKNVQYSISFSIEHIVLILILNVQYSIFNINNQYSILITPLAVSFTELFVIVDSPLMLTIEKEISLFPKVSLRDSKEFVRMLAILCPSSGQNGAENSKSRNSMLYQARDFVSAGHCAQVSLLSL